MKNACFAEQDTVKFGQPHGGNWDKESAQMTIDSLHAGAKVSFVGLDVLCMNARIRSTQTSILCNSVRLLVSLCPFFAHYEASNLPSGVD